MEVNVTSGARAFKLISPEDYLSQENDGTWRHEFVNGAVYAMSGASDQHNLIVGGGEGLIASLVSKPCQTFSRDMKVRISNNNDIRFYYPDLFVSCDPSDRAKNHRERPAFIIEVLSPSTERFDRTEKFEAYKCIPSLLEYGLLSQDQIELELFRRRTNWQREVYVQDNTVTLESLGITVMVSQIYARTDLLE